MWGNILTELSYIDNFNMGFSNTKSDVLIHLTQWQYWWWFWFTFLWVLYYLLVARVFRYRTLKFNPRIATTLRPHGKWGDLLTCLIPVTWCINILLNSNFVLKLIEWQSESSLFTLRVRAKQWYWIYKLDLKNISDIFSIPRNIGRNKWQFSTFGDLQTSEDYLHILQLRSQNQWIKKYWKDLLDKSTRAKNFHLITPQDTYKMEFVKNANLTFYKGFVDSFGVDFNAIDSCFTSQDLKLMKTSGTFVDQSFFSDKNYFLSNTEAVFGSPAMSWNDVLFCNVATTEDDVLDFEDTSKISGLFNGSKFLQGFDKTTYNYLITATFPVSDDLTGFGKVLNFSEFGDESRIVKRSFGKTTPLRVIKNPVVDIFNSKTFKNFSEEADLLRFRFNEFEAKLQQKPVPHTTYLTLKQKRYNVRNKIKPTTRVEERPVAYSFVENTNDLSFAQDVKSLKQKNSPVYSKNPFLKNLSIIEDNVFDPTRQYRMVKKAKNRLDQTSINTWNRLLRSKRILVLPAHVNITAITNSYDIVHSWHIPGLGLKMDCLPGRATHHTFYIDNVGLYFGQCAEICGRYHHHMPIRVCALPYEHFLVWWHTFGLPRLLFGKDNKHIGDKYLFRKFSW